MVFPLFLHWRLVLLAGFWVCWVLKVLCVLGSVQSLDLFNRRLFCCVYLLSARLDPLHYMILLGSKYEPNMPRELLVQNRKVRLVSIVVLTSVQSSSQPCP